MISFCNCLAPAPSNLYAMQERGCLLPCGCVVLPARYHRTSSCLPAFLFSQTGPFPHQTVAVEKRQTHCPRPRWLFCATVFYAAQLLLNKQGTACSLPCVQRIAEEGEMAPTNGV